MDLNRVLDIDFETPFQVIDMDQVKLNVEKMQNIATKNNKKLRPHSKTHKIPELSQLQLKYGATGICVQKISEAEVMFYGGVRDILVSNEIIGKKFSRAANLISQGAKLVVAVDNYTQLEQFSLACKHYHVEGEISVDLNIGMDRCGIDPNQLESSINGSKNFNNLNVVGIMAYDGHVQSEKLEDRIRQVEAEEEILERTVKELGILGLKDFDISVGGTPTAEIWAKSQVATELQPGTYIYQDTTRVKQGLCLESEIAMGVVSSVISESSGKRFVLDAGYKSVAIDHGYPNVTDNEGNFYRIISMSEEHTVIENPFAESVLQKKFLLYPGHACTTSDLWDTAYAIERGNNPRRIIIEGRGKRE